MTTPKLLTNEETQALFNFPDHIKFKFDWDGPGFDRIQLEEDLFVKFSKNKNISSSVLVFCNKKGQSHNLYGPSILWINGSTLYIVNNELHRLDGPAYTNFSSTGEKSVKYFINSKCLSTLEYWIAVDKYKQEHGIA